MSESVNPPFSNALQHLAVELERIELLVHRQVLRLRAARRLNEESYRGLFISDEYVDALLQQLPAGEAAGVTAPAAPSAASLAGRAEWLRRHIERRVEDSARAGVTLPLHKLTTLFGLSAFERDVLLLAVAPALQLRFETLYAYVQNDVAKKHLSVDLALNLLCPDFAASVGGRAAFATDAPLLRHHLIRVFCIPQECLDAQEPEAPLLARHVKADERIVDFLLGVNELDARIATLARLDCGDAPALDDPALPLEVNAIARVLQGGIPGSPCTEGRVVFLHGPFGVGKQAAARALCKALHVPLLLVDAGALPGAACGFEMALALIRRESLLRGAAICLGGFEHLLAGEARAIPYVMALERAWVGHAWPLFIASERAWRPAQRWQATRWFELELPLPDFEQRLRLWQGALEEQGALQEQGRATPASAAMADVAGKFILSAGQIRNAARAARDLAALHAGDEPGNCVVSSADLHAAAAAQSNQALGELAQKVEPKYSWEDIVLPPGALRQLRETLAAVRQRHVVYAQWGFGRKLALSKGVNILFAGPSGTGKTMAAQILAHELGLALYKIDLSTLVSKYIGETEKNLSRIFAEARTSNAILFFDEADALFGKRSEVKDAHDRYANIEVAYLLQRMEDYEGIVILATNLSQNLDDAFKRRMQHTIEFPPPDVERRARIWRGVFPGGAPLGDDADFDFLARQFELSGANIRNAALAAAFMAADEGAAIQMKHLILGTARELHKIGKLPSKAEFQQYYELIRERG